ncbi:MULTISPECIES: hypothetical protein [Paraburkholderia]|uniref:hypothetical protein n=1 Tax=Paraburkholderia TaxID=1822464 RepID=UPI00115F8A70|nr:hypothetical protein [Paraburkholderia fungorum]
MKKMIDAHVAVAAIRSRRGHPAPEGPMVDLQPLRCSRRFQMLHRPVESAVDKTHSQFLK